MSIPQSPKRNTILRMKQKDIETTLKGLDQNLMEEFSINSGNTSTITKSESKSENKSESNVTTKASTPQHLECPKSPKKGITTKLMKRSTQVDIEGLETSILAINEKSQHDISIISKNSFLDNDISVDFEQKILKQDTILKEENEGNETKSKAKFGGWIPKCPKSPKKNQAHRMKEKESNLRGLDTITENLMKDEADFNLNNDGEQPVKQIKTDKHVKINKENDEILRNRSKTTVYTDSYLFNPNICPPSPKKNIPNKIKTRASEVKISGLNDILDLGDLDSLEPEEKNTKFKTKAVKEVKDAILEDSDEHLDSIRSNPIQHKEIMKPPQSPKRNQSMRMKQKDLDAKLQKINNFDEIKENFLRENEDLLLFPILKKDDTPKEVTKKEEHKEPSLVIPSSPKKNITSKIKQRDSGMGMNFGLLDSLDSTQNQNFTNTFSCQPSFAREYDDTGKSNFQTKSSNNVIPPSPKATQSSRIKHRDSLSGFHLGEAKEEIKQQPAIIKNEDNFDKFKLDDKNSDLDKFGLDKSETDNKKKNFTSVEIEMNRTKSVSSDDTESIDKSEVKKRNEERQESKVSKFSNPDPLFNFIKVEQPSTKNLNMENTDNKAVNLENNSYTNNSNNFQFHFNFDENSFHLNINFDEIKKLSKDNSIQVFNLFNNHYFIKKFHFTELYIYFTNFLTDDQIDKNSFIVACTVRILFKQ